MPVIQVNDQRYSLRPGPNRLGAGAAVDVRVDADAALGVQAIVDVTDDTRAVIRRTGDAGAVRVNGIPLVEPTPLMHGDKVEIGGCELLYSEDSKAGATQFVSATTVAAMEQKRSGPARATAATGGRLVSLFDGKEYSVPADGISIGRDASCGVVVAQNEVSRNHAQVAPVAGGYEIRDLSANGVFVNGMRIDKTQMLSRADVIRIGTEELRFYADIPVATVAKPAAATKPAPAPASAAAPVVPAATVVPTASVGEERPVFATLEITSDGPFKAKIFEICVPLAHIGRGAHNDVAISDDSVSDTHAKLQRRDDGWYLVDVGSTNGTYVAGQRITAERRLDGTQNVRFGGVTMAFRPHGAGADTTMGTRVITSVDGSKLRETLAMPAPIVASTAPVQLSAKAGFPAWVWIVVVLVVAATAGFFLLNR